MATNIQVGFSAEAGRRGVPLQQFGKFQLLKKIASGGMAEIHIAKQRGLEGFEKIVVIKTILPHLVSNQEFVQMFLDEARIAARLTHPNIVQIYDLGRVGNKYFIAMEYVQGENLRQVARACRKKGQLLPLEHTVKIISQACEGLHYAHTKTDPAGRPLNIVHRDISPQNILVSFEGVAKIVDFGIAKAATQYQETRAGVLKGKYSYMSPEQCTGQPIDGRSDIFSMGIVLWELVTGVRLYKRDSELLILKDITEGEVPSPRQVNQRIPAELEAIILKCLEKDPANRFQSALELHLALEQFLKNHNLTSSSVHIAAFMRSLFADKLESLRKIEEAQAAGQRLEAFLFDDLEPSDLYGSGTGTTPARQAKTPTPISRADGSQPIYPKPTTGVSRVSTPPPPPPRRRGLWIGLLAVMLLLAGGGLVVWKLLPRPEPPPGSSGGAAGVAGAKPGTIKVTSTPAGATVLVDGQRVGTTPCQVSDLKLGEPYTLEVVLGGHPKWSTRFTLDSPEIRPFHAQLQALVASGKGTVEVVTTPPGARVTLDGKAVAGVTPLTIEGVSAGPRHELLASLPGHQSWSTTFVISAGQKLSLAGKLPAEPQAGGSRPAVYQLRSQPPGASFTLDGRPVSDTISLRPGRSYRIEARLQGYNAWSKRLRPRPGLRKTIVARLVPRQQAQPRNTGPALVTIDSQPWSSVFIDGTLLGTTPLSNLRLAPGKHKVRLLNDQLKCSKNFTLEVAAGQRVTKKVVFGQGFLKVIAKPWAHVLVNGRKIGTTPLPPQRLYEGSYQVVLKNPTLGRSEERTVKIVKGRTAQVSVNFLE